MLARALRTQRDRRILPAPSARTVEQRGGAAAWKKLGLPSGADFFLSFRKFIASHEDTFVTGPTSAADYLATRQQK